MHKTVLTIANAPIIMQEKGANARWEVEEMKISEFKFDVALANSGLTIGELAKNAGVSRNRVNVILNQKTVTPRAAGLIARGLGVDVLEIIETE